jgi:hypothetical protein
MSTRAVVTVADDDESFHLYTHHDGYPSYTARRLLRALDFAWPLPRFQSSEFAAAFAAASKSPRQAYSGGLVDQGGSIYLTSSWERHGDLAFRYVVTQQGTGLRVEAFRRDHTGPDPYHPIYDGDLAGFVAFAGIRAPDPDRMLYAVAAYSPVYGLCHRFLRASADEAAEIGQLVEALRASGGVSAGWVIAFDPVADGEAPRAVEKTLRDNAAETAAGAPR